MLTLTPSSRFLSEAAYQVLVRPSALGLARPSVWRLPVTGLNCDLGGAASDQVRNVLAGRAVQARARAADAELGLGK